MNGPILGAKGFGWKGFWDHGRGQGDKGERRGRRDREEKRKGETREGTPFYPPIYRIYIMFLPSSIISSETFAL